MENPGKPELQPDQAKAPGKRRMFFSFSSRLFRFAGGVTLLGAFVAGGFLIGGFLKFADRVTGYQAEPTSQKADAIVVFTGGSRRIETAAKLLQSGQGKRLLVSGVFSKTSRHALQERTNISKAVFDCCVDIDKKAADTIGNAEEAAKWAKKHGFNKLLIVTSTYHMPRSILEVERRLPDATLIAHPVKAVDIDMENWYKDRKTLHLLFSEYSKYIIARVRPAIGDKTVRNMRAGLLGN